VVCAWTNTNRSFGWNEEKTTLRHHGLQRLHRPARLRFLPKNQHATSRIQHQHPRHRRPRLSTLKQSPPNYSRASLNKTQQKKVPKNNRLTILQHFELVSEPSLQTAQQTLLSSLEPELNALLSRVETHLDKMSRREQSLLAKAELQEGRLSNPSQAARQSSSSRQSAAGAASSSSHPSSHSSTGGLSSLEQLKISQLRQKKERLSYAVGRLELQAGQRERQLRKSMAFQ
jgi:DASH complex subunit SPC19